MGITSYAELETTCRNIFAGLSGIVTWKWDDRFNIPLAEFKTIVAGQVQAVLAKEFGFSWDHKTMSKAPKVVQKFSKDIGGIRDKQLVFATDPANEIILFAAWWPWGNNLNVSSRIAVGYSNKPAKDEKEQATEMKKWFEIK